MKWHSWLAVTAGLLAVCVAPVAGQMGKGSLELGLKGGATFSKASSDGSEDIELKNLTGFVAGASLRIPLGAVALQPELLYVQKGTSAELLALAGATLDVRMSYIEVPLLLMVPFGSGDGFTPYAFGGGAVAFEAKCEAEIKSDLPLQDNFGGAITTKSDCDDGGGVLEGFERKKTDFGAVFGAGLRMPAGSGSFLVEGRYTLGLVNLDDSSDGDASFKQRSFAVQLGYSFTLGH